jgi:hypothetical protein
MEIVFKRTWPLCVVILLTAFDAFALSPRSFFPEMLKTVAYEILDRYLPEGDPDWNVRRRHVEKVIRMHDHFVSERFDAVYDAIPENHRDGSFEENRREYISLLGQLKKRYDALSPEERYSLYIAVILHDIGYPLGFEWIHNVTGSIKARRELESRLKDSSGGFFRGLVPGIQQIIRTHGCIPNMGVNVLPRDLESFSPGQKLLILLIDIFDAAGKASGSLVSLEVLERFVNFYEHLSSFVEKGEFYEYRFQNNLMPFVWGDPGENGALWRKVKPLVKNKLSPPEWRDFQSNWNERIRVYVFGLFQLFAKEDRETGRAYAEFIRLLSLVSDYVIRANDLDNGLIIDTDIDFMEMPMEKRLKYLEILRNGLASVPGNLSSREIRERLRRSNGTSINELFFHYGTNEEGKDTLFLDLDRMENRQLQKELERPLIHNLSRKQSGDILTLKATYSPAWAHSVHFAKITKDPNTIHQKHPELKEAVVPGYLHTTVSLNLVETLLKERGLSPERFPFSHQTSSLFAPVLSGNTYQLEAALHLDDPETKYYGVSLKDASGSTVYRLDGFVSSRGDLKLEEVDPLHLNPGYEIFRGRYLGSDFEDFLYYAGDSSIASPFLFLLSHSSRMIIDSLARRPALLHNREPGIIPMYVQQNIFVNKGLRIDPRGEVKFRFYLSNPGAFGRRAKKTEDPGNLWLHVTDLEGNTLFVTHSPLTFQPERLIHFAMKRIIKTRERIAASA